jgi:hypothetical protein
VRIIRTPYRLLPSRPIGKANELPTTNGLYYVATGFHLLYVGKATGFRQRWYKSDKREIKAEYPSARIYYRQRWRWRLSTDEAFEIQRLRPSLNEQRPKPGNFPIANFFACTIDLLHFAGVLGTIVLLLATVRHIGGPIDLPQSLTTFWRN